MSNDDITPNTEDATGDSRDDDDIINDTKTPNEPTLAHGSKALELASPTHDKGTNKDTWPHAVNFDYMVLPSVQTHAIEHHGVDNGCSLRWPSGNIPTSQRLAASRLSY